MDPQFIHKCQYLSNLIRDFIPNISIIDISVYAGGNDVPTANAGPDLIGKVGYIVYFDGSGSWDPNNDNLTYKWEFGDGSLTGWKNDSKTSHKYTNAGNY